MSIWTEPRYPGDAVRILLLKRSDELGSIAIKQYGQTILVGSRLPDTRPEKHEWCASSFAADEVFDKYANEAYADGWQNCAEPGGVTIDWMTGRAVDDS